jgi:hypothetical protein
MKQRQRTLKLAQYRYIRRARLIMRDGANRYLAPVYISND